jgi:hypothetical protein
MSKRYSSPDQELQEIKAIDRQEKEAQDALDAEKRRSDYELQRIPAMIDAMRRCPSPLGVQTADEAWLDRMADLLAALKVAGKPDLLKQLPSRGNARRFTQRCVELLTAGERGQAVALLKDIGLGKLDAELARERNADLPDDLCRLLDLAIPQPLERHRPEAVNDDGHDATDLLSETQQNILRALRLLKADAPRRRVLRHKRSISTPSPRLTTDQSLRWSATVGSRARRDRAAESGSPRKASLWPNSSTQLAGNRCKR